MPVGSVAVTEGSGKNLHTWQRSVSSVNREEQYVQIGESGLATYTAAAAGVSAATSASHLLQLMAPSNAYVRVHRITLDQNANATSVVGNSIAVYRLTTAGTGGSSVTPSPFDTGDTAGATAMTLPSSKGTEGVMLLVRTLILRQVLAATGSQYDDVWEWVATPGKKPIIIPSGTSNGIVVKNGGGGASATLNVEIEFTETAWL